jgi:hypothetical protein
MDARRLESLPLLPLLVSFSLLGCGEQIRFGASQTRSTIPEILEDQALNNAATAAYNPLFIPAQISLKESLTSAVNTLNSGVAPNIALRAIAITGLIFTSSNAITQNWSATPISGYLDIKRLQVFYNYAINRTTQTFDDFQTQLYEIGGKPKSTMPLSQQIGKLPPGPFLRLNDPDHCPGGLERSLGFRLDRICIPGGQIVTGSSTPIAPDALLSLFIMWSIAIPALSAPEGNVPAPQGASPREIGRIPPPSITIQ